MASHPLTFGPAIGDDEFQRIKQRMALDFCKWDSQVGDIPTLFRQPLLISSATWRRLKSSAEQLAQELEEAEAELMARPELHRVLGIPTPLQHVFERKSRNLPNQSIRTLRFDFHYTTSGWCISEVNSDVPGGFTESSRFTALMSECCPNTKPTGDPTAQWIDAALSLMGDCGRVGLLSAPGFLEDQQVTAFLAGQLQAHQVETFLLHDPSQFIWNDGVASVLANGRPLELGFIVRFYQAEWLAKLTEPKAWKALLVGNRTPVSNPASSLLTESKRLPLLWNHLSSKMETWETLMPECRDPGDRGWKADDSWVVKGAFSNNGDEVYATDQKNWTKILTAVRKNSNAWVAQHKFETVPATSDFGPLYPCVGVYTINGHAAGVYARASTERVTNYSAMETALLISEEKLAEQR